MWMELDTLSHVVWDNEVGDRETGMDEGRNPSCTLNVYPALRSGPSKALGQFEIFPQGPLVGKEDLIQLYNPEPPFHFRVHHKVKV